MSFRTCFFWIGLISTIDFGCSDIAGLDDYKVKDQKSTLDPSSTPSPRQPSQNRDADMIEDGSLIPNDPDGFEKDGSVSADGFIASIQDTGVDGSEDDESTCELPRKMCDDQCVSLDDPRYCGSCDHDCTKLPNVVPDQVSCSDQGECILSLQACRNEYADCATDLEDGCETSITTSSDCGECGSACPSETPLCSETSKNSDGMSVYECVIECEDPTPNQCGSTCVNTNTSPIHCGRCDNDCSAVTDGTPICDNGSCDFVCESDWHRCDDQCMPNNSEDSCGSSCSPCTSPQNATATCDGTSCGFICDTNFMRRNDRCIPSSNCCRNADCSNDFACVSGSCLSFCQQQSPPAGIADSDYQCLDFDTSTNLPWPVDEPSKTTSANNARAYSLPRSFQSGADSSGDGSISWQAVGGYDVDTMTVTMRVYPDRLTTPTPSGVTVRFLSIQTTDQKQSLYYVNDVTIFTLDQGYIDNYTGYLVNTIYRGGAAIVFDCPLTDTLNWNGWNTIEYTAGPPNTVRFNGMNVGDCASPPYGTSPTLSLGLADNSWSVTATAYFDNIVVSAVRSGP